MTTSIIPTSEPLEITRGETVQWSRSLWNYPPSDGWTLTTYFRGTGKGVDVVAEVDGSRYLSTMTAAQSEALSAGRYDWQAWVEMGSGDDVLRHQVEAGIVTVKLGFHNIETETAVDGRSDTKKALDAIRAKLANVATSDQLSYVIGDRQVQRYSRNELIEVEKLFSRLYNQEVRKERVRRGGSFFQNVNVRFTEPK